MLIDFFFTLKDARVPVSIKEFLLLLEALEKNVINPSIDEFYYLARTTLVKDEANFDKFDKAFGYYFHGAQTLFDKAPDVPLDWLIKRLQRELTPEQKAQLEKFGYDKNRSAVKVWDARAFRDYDSERELGTRNIKVALRRLRQFAREGLEEELALDDTIRATANNAGWLDLKMQPERKNKVKVLMLMDVGGTMDDHIAQVEELFSAAKSEFKNMEFFYFHNCVYDHLWKHNHRRHAERFPSWDVIRKYPADTKLIFVGDATMSPYEIVQPGGSVEYNNEEAGAVWIQRFTQQFSKYVWLNPEPEGLWQYRQSITIIRQLMSDRMYPITMEGLDRAMQWLSK